MKLLLSFFACCFLTLSSFAQKDLAKAAIPATDKKIQLVEVSCGKCKLGLVGKTCDMAVRINGKSYYADGASIDDFGDAHAGDGMCNAIRQAEVQGELVKDRFVISYIKVLPAKTTPAGKD